MATRQQTSYERNAPDPGLVRRALADSKPVVFWREEAGAAARFPQLTKSAQADLTVVGAGFLGLWTAIFAKRRNPGQHVVLVEAEAVGWAASGRNGGFCEASLTHGDENGRARWPDEFDTLERLGRQNLDEFERDVAEFGIDCHWERNGTLRVAVEEHQVAWLANVPDRLTAGEAGAEINSPLFLGGLRDPYCAMLQPARLALELARVATELGVEIFENSRVTDLQTPRSGQAIVHTETATITTDRVVLATNVFSPLLRRNRLMTVPVYDYVLMTEPLSPDHMASIGWKNRQGLADLANQFHYSRLTKDNRILYGGYDAIYHAGRKVKPQYEERPETFQKLASHFLATFPQLSDISFTHRWAGAIDTCTQFAAFYGLARRDRVAYAAGFTGLGVGATRFAANVLLDLLSGERNERTELEMVRRRPLPFPPEPFATAGINLTRWSLDRADHQEGRRNAYLRILDRVGLGFDS
ncbi:NAD(P)/FAD-dependent oxidoreductase [Kribbella speibonae]|uniref:FAD-dependent oxidoreductase n=1 Tax=Kribbella speibonae TaxID=1572660 RepID=A0A4R0IRK5_9ACTN|nr:FAD-dependent oxidoreductase [Kribbella speibonae]TCC36423.1 FAD-dependent oxidoreductase [Kribbella speibonae]